MTQPANKNKHLREIELGEPWTASEAQRILSYMGYRYLYREFRTRPLAVLSHLMGDQLFRLDWHDHSVYLVSLTRGRDFLVL
jgi:hypothetical protein